MRNPYSCLYALVLFTASATLPAQEPESDAAEPVRYYQVELLIFRNLDQSGNTAEIPQIPEPELTEQLDTDLARLTDEPQSIESPLSDNPEDTAETQEWFEVDPESLLLAGTARSIRQLQAYELISYLSWGQTAPDVTTATPIRLADLGVDNSVLNGEVELYQRRYLHLALDVALVEGESIAVATDSELQLPAGVAPPPAIRDSRRIRLEKLQYFDQPKFGVIAVVSRFETEASDES
jgi:hypothetical protein